MKINKEIKQRNPILFIDPPICLRQGVSFSRAGFAGRSRGIPDSSSASAHDGFCDGTLTGYLLDHYSEHRRGYVLST